MKNLLHLLFTWWGETTLGTLVHTKRNGTLVGSDEFGNKYYKQRVPNNPSYADIRKGERRWVVYANPQEASAIPVGWHGWMHYRTDIPPSQDQHVPWPWELKHKPNMTGTSGAYRPDGSILTPASRPEVSGDYEAWTP